MAARPTSQLLREIVAGIEAERVDFRSLIEALGERGFGIFVLVLTLPAVIPAPPGVGSVFGLPLMYFAAQMLLGLPRPALPRRFADKTVATKDLRKVVDKAAPWLARLERLCRPGRMPGLVAGRAQERAIGGLILFLALVVSLPGPFTNGPPGLVVAILCIGLIEEDGLLILVGAVSSIFATAIAFSGIAAMAATIWYSAARLLG